MDELMAYVTTELDPTAIEYVLGTMAGHSPRGDGGALLFLIEAPDGSVLFQDTSGHWTGIVDDLDADVAIVAAAGRANVDGEPIQGTLAEFVADHIRRIGPKRAILCHHDNWLPGFSIDTDVAPIREKLAEVAPGTELLELGYVDGTRLF